MKAINRALKKYLESEEQEADFKHQVGNSTLLVAVLNRFILDGLHSSYKKQLQLNPCKWAHCFPLKFHFRFNWHHTKEKNTQCAFIPHDSNTKTHAQMYTNRPQETYFSGSKRPEK